VKRTYLIVLEKGKEAWGAFAPDVAGTGGMGDTQDEARESLKEGIGYILEDCLERHLPFPDAVSTTVDFSQFEPDPTQSVYIVQWITVDLPDAKPRPGNIPAQAA
jgi:predicted RNase H-like HicB family nuclease